MQDLGLSGTVVVVTGAGGGIGGAACAEFLDAGAKTVIGVDIDGAALSQTAERLAAPTTFDTVTANLAEEGDVQRVVQQVLDRYGAIDVLFNNASIEGEVAPLTEYSTETFDRVMAVNVRAVFLAMKYTLPGMVANRSGSVVNMGSTASFRGPAHLAGYSASKHAVIGLTRTAAGEVAQFGVRVNALCPGPTDTRMMTAIESMANPEAPASAHDQWVAGIPRGRYGDPHELARVAVVLASPSLANVTGAAWLADGGLTAV